MEARLNKFQCKLHVFSLSLSLSCRCQVNVCWTSPQVEIQEYQGDPSKQEMGGKSWVAITRCWEPIWRQSTCKCLMKNINLVGWAKSYYIYGETTTAEVSNFWPVLFAVLLALLLVTVEGDTNQSLVSCHSILFTNSFEGECLLIGLLVSVCSRVGGERWQEGGLISSLYFLSKLLVTENKLCSSCHKLCQPRILLQRSN